MIEIREMGDSEILELIKAVGYGHLACTDGKSPYVVPVHYGYQEPYIYLYTTEGKKSEIIGRNPRVCLQIEEVHGNKNWKSAIIDGEAEQLSDETERLKALEAVVRVNPTLTPAVSIHWMDNWVRENIEVIFRITAAEMSGRASVVRSDLRAVFVPKKRPERNAKT